MPNSTIQRMTQPPTTTVHQTGKDRREAGGLRLQEEFGRFRSPRVPCAKGGLDWTQPTKVVGRPGLEIGTHSTAL
jgi:hypothetical protein